MDSKETRAQAFSLRSKGLSYAEIGEHMGFSRQRAQQLLKPAPEVRKYIKERAKGKCEKCGIEVRHGHIHHVKCVGTEPDDYGDIGNLQYLCIGCHQQAHGGWTQMWDTATAEVRKDWKKDSRVPLSQEGLTLAGQKGGSSRSEAKRLAAKTNLAKARRKRWAKVAPK